MAYAHNFKLKILNFRVENLEQFARDLLAGKLVQYLKSEPVPTENSDAVRVSTFTYKNIN